MAEPTIIREQREVVRTIDLVAAQHLQEEAEAEARLRLDRDAADQSLAETRAAAGRELRRAGELVQEADRIVGPRAGQIPASQIVPVAPPNPFDADLMVGLRIVTAQMEARLVRIRAALTDGSSGNLVTRGIILGAVVATASILIMPFVAGSGGAWSLGWFGAMISPLAIALLISGARATFLRPYSPDEDYRFIRDGLGHVLYLHQAAIDDARATHDRRLTEWQARFDEAKEKIAQSFKQQLALIEPTIITFSTASQTLGPEWDAPSWRTWTPSDRLPHVTCVGELQVGVHEDRLSLPALVPFPHEKALIVKTDSHARARAIAAIQSILLRLVATIPRGDLRLILIDPVGKGQSVAPFTPFADLQIGVGEGRAWSEPGQIEQRLHDLANMIEASSEANAFQSMLPRLDASRASGVAEPCWVLVVLDFPTNVGGATARLLSTVIQKGPAHSVHTILMVDTEQPTPYGLNLLELEGHATTLAWDGRRFTWQDPDFRTSWVELDKPPRSALARQILRGVSQPTSRTA